MNLDELAQQHLPKLHEWADRLLVTVRPMANQVQYAADDHFAFMALTFLSRQISHIESMLVLDTHLDTQLIARSMLEGMCQLLWASKEPNERALQWRHFFCISDWREMQAALAHDLQVDANQRNMIEKKLIQYGKQFIKPNADKKLKKSGKLPNDPYFENWTKLNVRQIFDDVKATVLCRLSYASFSNWHHWSPSGLAPAIEHQEVNTNYIPQSFSRAWLSLLIGIQCLLETAEIVNRHLKLSMTTILDELKDEYIQWHKELGLATL